VLEKYSNIKIRVLLRKDWRTEERNDGRKDRHYEANSRFSQFCKRI